MPPEDQNNSAGIDSQGSGTGALLTQDDVNRLVNERLAAERAKYADYEALKEKAAKYDAAEEASKSDLQKANDLAAGYKKQLDEYREAERIKGIRAKIAKEKNVPEELLFGSTEDECRSQADKLQEFARPSSYPDVRDGGEKKGGTGGTAADAFARWFNFGK